MEKEFVKKTVLTGALFLFLAIILVNYKPEMTGFSILNGASAKQTGIGLLSLAAVTLLFIILNKGKTKEIIKNILGAAAIVLGIYATSALIPSADILIAALSLTFGIMALIWVWKAKNAFSIGSQLRDFTGSFLSCLVAVLIFSLYDNVLAIFNLGSNWAYGKYALITIAYINFALTAYKMRKLGDVFGFSEQSLRVKKAMKAKMQRTR